MLPSSFPGAARAGAALLACILGWSAAGAEGASLVTGYRRYHAACNHCHGPDGIGSTFAPSLVTKSPDPEIFKNVVRTGKASGASVMKGFGDDPNIAPYVDDIYLYLKARAEGAIGRGRPPP